MTLFFQINLASVFTVDLISVVDVIFQMTLASVFTIDLISVDDVIIQINLASVFTVDVISDDDVVFQIHTWLVYATLDMSVWVLVALTLERLVSVYIPHRVKKHCTAVTSFISLSVIATALLCINSHFLYGLGDVVHNM